MSSKNVTLRPATPDDEPLLLEVYASTRAQELAMTNWSEEQKDAFIKMQLTAQQQHYQAYYPEGQHRIILLNGEPVGRLYMAEIEDQIRIMDITILPAHRNGGIGTPLIKDVLARAQEVGKPVRIYVEYFNPSLRLFERLGFAKVGEEGINFLLEWRPRT